MLISGLTGVACAAHDGRLQQLRSDRDALAAAQREFRLSRERGDLSAAETADYRAYLERLKRRVEADCKALAEVGVRLPPDSGCPRQPGRRLGPLPLDQASERTGREQTSALDAELEKELGDFDEKLLREQERVKAARPRASGGVAGSGGGAAGAGEEQGGAEATAGQGQQGKEGREQGDGTSKEGGGGQTAPGTGARSAGRGTGNAPPPDVPDGSDDDVVARQLREAAENETDPELRKKLWDEYRKYKRGTR